MNTIKDIAGIKLNLLEKMNLILARKDDKLEVHCTIGYQLLRWVTTDLPRLTGLAEWPSGQGITVLNTPHCCLALSNGETGASHWCVQTGGIGPITRANRGRSSLLALCIEIFDDDIDIIGPPNKDMAIIITKRFDVLGTRSTFNPLTCFTGPQEFYRDFIILAATTSTAFIQHLLDNMIDELLSLNRTVFTASDLEESGHLGSSIDILDIVDKKSLYFCCPFIREVQLLLGSHHSEISPILDSCIEKRVLPSSVDFIISEHFENSVIEKNKMVTPFIFTSKLNTLAQSVVCLSTKLSVPCLIPGMAKRLMIGEKWIKTLEMKLRETFFHSQPASIRKTVDLVTERVASCCAKFLCLSVLPPIKKAAISDFIKFFRESGIQAMTVSSLTAYHLEIKSHALRRCLSRISAINWLVIDGEVGAQIPSEGILGTPRDHSRVLLHSILTHAPCPLLGKTELNYVTLRGISLVVDEWSVDVLGGSMCSVGFQVKWGGGFNEKYKDKDIEISSNALEGHEPFLGFEVNDDPMLYIGERQAHQGAASTEFNMLAERGPSRPKLGTVRILGFSRRLGPVQILELSRRLGPVQILELPRCRLSIVGFKNYNVDLSGLGGKVLPRDTTFVGSIPTSVDGFFLSDKIPQHTFFGAEAFGSMSILNASQLHYIIARDEQYLSPSDKGVRQFRHKTALACSLIQECESDKWVQLVVDEPSTLIHTLFRV
uniref:Codanin-1 C-terminal domain-containing protein n=1 Tax=Timema tahoe TaxID=61484 RepID=A0A7R9IHE0_9NEOP|nr:unnamed protein product [Timema tahoe]